MIVRVAQEEARAEDVEEAAEKARAEDEKRKIRSGR